MDAKKPFHEVVANRLIEQLKQGTAPWIKPWKAGEPNRVLPNNPVTGARYRGINAIHLLAQERADTRWMTYRQALTIGGQVRKGERSTSVQYWKFNDEVPRLRGDGRPVLDAHGCAVTDAVRLERPRVFFASVFNAEQIEGLPTPTQLKSPSWNLHERAEGILAAAGATIIHGEGDRAFYRLGTDAIHLPAKNQFETADRYYATALHELGHWTGHPTRLARDLANPFGSDAFAREELRAEIASMIIGDELGIGHDPGQHVAYVASWIKVLEEDPLELFRAAAAAEKIYDYVLTCEQQLSAKQVVSTAPTAADVVRPVQELEHHPNPLDLRAAQARQAKQDADLQAVLEDPDIQSRAASLAREGEAGTTIDSARTYLNVPFDDKDHAKRLGARWDRNKRAWYAPGGVDPGVFSKWNQAPVPTGEGVSADKTQLVAGRSPERIYLAVPYVERTAARAAGALWDRAAKSWYVGPNADPEALRRWDSARAVYEQGPPADPREEFAAVLRSMGCAVTDSHPVMDGKPHRIRAEGDAKGELAGFYVGHLDGHPAGYVKNNRTGAEMKWKSKGYVLEAGCLQVLQADCAAKLQERREEQAQRHEEAAARVSKQLEDLVPIRSPVSYLKAKGVQAHSGVWTDKGEKTIYVPAVDANGKHWTTQYIQEDGTKRFARDSRKEGCFHPIGGMGAIEKAPVLLIAEGYATAASLAEATGHGAIVAFDCGNLVHVARAIRQKYPDKTIVIAGDNDESVESKRGINPGRHAAEEAARAVGGRTAFPTFAPGERLGSGKELTDFNDLAQRSVLGLAGVSRQIAAVVDHYEIISRDVPNRIQKTSRAMSIS